MVSNQYADLEDSTEAISTAKRRRLLPLTVKLLVAIAALCGVVLFILIQRSSNLEWYASPPIDARGRRVHILVPVGYISDYSGDDGRTWGGGYVTIDLRPDPYGRQPSLMQKWLKRLRLVSADNPDGHVTLRFDETACAQYNHPRDQGLTADGKVHVLLYGDLARAIPVGGTNREVLVIYGTEEPKDTISNTANTICNSMYVK